MVDQIKSCASKWVCFIVYGFITCMSVCQHCTEFGISNRKHMQKRSCSLSKTLFFSSELRYMQNTAKLFNMATDNNLSF